MDKGDLSPLPSPKFRERGVVGGSDRPLTVVSMAYPLLPIGCDTVGGSEQVLGTLDAALVDRGHRSIVIGCEGSKVAGNLIATPACEEAPSPAAWDRAYELQWEILQRVLAAEAVDVVHLHGMDAHTRLPNPGLPLLITLHLPPFNYPEGLFRSQRPLTFFNCVSHFSRSLYPRDIPIPVIPNGVSLDRFRPGPAKEDFVLALGRICPEKGFHLALDAAKKAGLPMILGGKVPPFPEHERYFEEEIRPRLDDQRQFRGVIPFAQRIDLLARARCLAVPSLVEESSSLVAIEALACGTPVVAHPVGALPENIAQGVTGLLVGGVEEMARAFRDVVNLDPRVCRLAASERFSAEGMAQGYLDLYGQLSALHRTGKKEPVGSTGSRISH